MFHDNTKRQMRKRNRNIKTKIKINVKMNKTNKWNDMCSMITQSQMTKRYTKITIPINIKMNYVNTKRQTFAVKFCPIWANTIGVLIGF